MCPYMGILSFANEGKYKNGTYEKDNLMKQMELIY